MSYMIIVDSCGELSPEMKASDISQQHLCRLMWTIIM